MLDMQVGLFTLLSEFNSICKKHNITYYLEGGSLLGAVRHKGFLPWDDDVDLCITRANWLKLLSVIDEELPENRELYCFERFPQYMRDTVKYTNLDTTVIFKNHVLDGLACGQHIDLFVMDPAPADEAKKEEYKALAHVYSELMMPVYVMCNDISKYLPLYKEYKAIMDKKGRDYTLNLLREKLFTIEDTEEIKEYYLRWGNNHRFFKKEFFGEPVYLEFEGELFPAPPKYHRFLRAEFGDSWMIIPEVAHREEHNTYDNYNVPCKDFIADYSPYINYEKARKNYLGRKNHYMKNIALGEKIKEENAKALKAMYKVSLGKSTLGLTATQKELLEKGEYFALANSLSAYVDAQTDSDLRAYNLALEVSEEVLYAACLSNFMIGRFWNTQRLINVNLENKELISNRVAPLWEKAEQVRSMVLASEEGRIEDSLCTANELKKEYPLQKNVAFTLLDLEYRKEGASEQLYQRVKNLLSLYENDDELLYLLGCVSADLNKEEAKEYFAACQSKTRNGILLMALKERENN